MKSTSCRIGIMVIFLLLSLAVVYTTRCYAYNDVRVYGAVSDETGAPVPEASVTFISASDTTVTTTDDAGMYSVMLSSVSTGVSDEPCPGMFLLHQNYPNPFNPSTVIEYELMRRSNVRLEIFNMAGQVVRILRNGEEEPGGHRALWNGCDENGNASAAGVYLYRLTADGFRQAKKMVLLDGGLTPQTSFDAMSTPLQYSPQENPP